MLALLIPTQATQATGQATAKAAQPHLTTLTTDVFAPFNLSVSTRGIYVADGGPGIVSRLRWNGDLTPLVTDAAGTSGVAPRGKLLAYTTTVTDDATFENIASALNIVGPHGTTKANTLRYERRHNPDHVNTYGFANPTQCQVDALGPDAQYAGRKDSHAYSVASWGQKWIVADAGANDLLLVSPKGRHISTLAVLPPQPAVITKAFAKHNGLDPDCFVGSTYGFEPVPTDVEVAPNGTLYVTTLPGGDEGPDLGARGSLWRINPQTGHSTLVATGFAGATNLAIGPDGAKYVTELFAGRIAIVTGKHSHTYVDLPGVVSVEPGNLPGRLIAGTLDPTFQGPGSIVRINARRHLQSVT